jgi:hypothetical protein
MQTRTYNAPGLSADSLADKTRQWFADNGFETQVFRNANHHLLVQGFRDDLWRSAIGLGTAITVQIFSPSGDTLQVDIGAGAWGDKFFTAGIGLLFFYPLVLSAAWGSFEQYKLDQDVWKAIEAALPTASTTIETVLPTEVISTPDLPTTWFNEESTEVYSTQFFQRMETWQRAMADGVIEPAEIQAQSELVTGLLRTLEPTLSDEAHAKLSEVFNEVAVLQGMQSYALFQHIDETKPAA